MTTDNAYEIKLAVNKVRRRYTMDELREAFKRRTMDTTFSYIGRLASDRFLDDIEFAWLGYEIAIGYSERVFDVPFMVPTPRE